MDEDAIIIICGMPQCQTAAGCVCGMSQAKVGDSMPMLSPDYVTSVPAKLGRVVKLELRGNKVIAHTDSGQTFVQSYKEMN